MVIDFNDVGHNRREGYRGDVLFERVFIGCDEPLHCCERVPAGIVVEKLTDIAIHDDSWLDSAHVCVPHVLPDSNSENAAWLKENERH